MQRYEKKIFFSNYPIVHMSCNQESNVILFTETEKKEFGDFILFFHINNNGYEDRKL